MPEPVNPYAAPEADISVTPFAEVSPLTIPGLRTTGIGLSLIYYGIILILLAVVVMLLGGMMMGLALSFRGGNNSPGGIQAMSRLVVVFGISLLAGGLLSFAGQIVCLFVPARTGAQGYVIAAVLLQILSIVLYVFSLFQRSANIPWLIISMVLVNLCGIASMILFVLFMRKISEFIGRWDYMNRARNLLVLVAVLAVTFVGLISASALTFSNEAIRIVLSLFLMVGALCAFVMYANLVNALRKVLLAKAPRMQNAVPLDPEAGK